MENLSLTAPGMDGPGHQDRQQPLGLERLWYSLYSLTLKQRFLPSPSPEGKMERAFFCYEEVQALAGSR